MKKNMLNAYYLITGYLHAEDGVVWLWHSLVNLYIWLTISSCYCSIPLTLVLIRRNSGLSTLCHSCRFACQQRVLKTLPGPGYLHCGDGIVWLWHSLVNFLCIYSATGDLYWRLSACITFCVLLQWLCFWMDCIWTMTFYYICSYLFIYLFLWIC